MWSHNLMLLPLVAAADISQNRFGILRPHSPFTTYLYIRPVLPRLLCFYPTFRNVVEVGYGNFDDNDYMYVFLKACA